MAVGSFAAASFTIFGIFPDLQKKWPKRDVANLPHLSMYVFDKNSPKRPETAIPSIFFKKETLALQSQAFFLVPLGFKINFFACLAKMF